MARDNKDVKIIGPKRKWESSPEILEVTVKDSDHTPYNGGYHKHCYATLNINQHIEGDWVSFQMEETTVGEKSGRYHTKVISLSVPRSMAEAIAEFILHKR